MLAGLGLAGANALSGCADRPAGPDAEELAFCHRAIQKAVLTVQVAGGEMATDEKFAAQSQLEEADHRILHVWARHEGLDISAAQFADETGRATAFLEGINAEAGLSEQEKLGTLSAASEAPESWREHVNTALDCAERLAP